MKCLECEGKGFKEYDAGLLQIGCKTCSGIGKVDCELTKDEFERAYAFRSDMTPDQVLELGLEAVPSDCVEGWAMEKVVISTNLVDDPLPHSGSGMGKVMDDLMVQAKVTAHIDGNAVLHVVGVKDDNQSDSGDQPDNQSLGSRDTSQSIKPKKSKAKKTTRK